MPERLQIRHEFDAFPNVEPGFSTAGNRDRGDCMAGESWPCFHRIRHRQLIGMFDGGGGGGIEGPD